MLTNSKMNRTSNNPLDFGRVKSIRLVREWLGLSQSQIGEIMAIRLGRSTSFDRSYICKMERARRVPAAWLPSLGQLIANELYRQLGRDDIGVIITQNSPLKIQAWSHCAGCKRAYRIMRRNQINCQKCR